MTVEEATALIESMAAALSRHDRDGWVACFHPDLEGYSGLAAMESGVPYTGLAGAGQWFDNLLDVYETLEASVQQTIMVGNHALHLLDVRYVGKGSGIVLTPVLTWVCEVRDGLYVYARSHFETADGFRDMGGRLASKGPD